MSRTTIDKYEIIERIGPGYLGEVFKGRDPDNGQFVAIKLLSPEFCDTPKAKKRSQQQIDRILQLNHPDLVNVYGSGEYRGCLYFVMEYIKGTTAKEQLTRGVFEERFSLEIIVQIAQALEYICQYDKVWQRDISPDNIMICCNGQGKFADMGIDKGIAIHVSSDRIDEAAALGAPYFIGIPHYMSPEHTLGYSLDLRSHIFSLGSTWYHMLTGSPPFEGTNAVFIMEAVMKSEITPILERNPKISDETCAIVAKMLAKDRNERYQNFAELIADLQAVMNGQKPLAPVVARPPRIEFRDGYVLGTEEVLLGKIAIDQKFVDIEQMERCLDRQEQLYLAGSKIPLSNILFHLQMIDERQLAFLHRTLGELLVERGDEGFVKACTINNFLTAPQRELCRRLHKEGTKGIAAVLFADDEIDDDTKRRIAATVQHMINPEYEDFLKAAVQHNLASQTQIERSARIYAAQIIHGKYEPIDDLMVRKGYLAATANTVLLRAFRRSALTGKAVAEYIEAQKG